MFGPPFFGLTLLVLTIMDQNFLRSLGWDPLRAPTFDWPSGLSLGPHGTIMIVVFIVNGLLMMVFAIGLGQSLPPERSSRLATILMLLAGLAMMGLAFLTDPTIRSTPATWHGKLHDLSFVVLGLTLFPAMLFLGSIFHSSEDWHGLSWYTWLTVALALPAFALKGIAFYLFLAAVLLWNTIIARRLEKFHGD